MSIGSDSKRIVLIDSDQDRAMVIADMLFEHGLQVIPSSIHDALLLLKAPELSCQFLMACIDPTTTRLLQALEHRHCEEMLPLPILMFWSQHGEIDLFAHRRFLEKTRALVFDIPLDVDLVLRVVEALAT